MQIINEEVSNDVSEAISTSTMPLSQAKQIYTAYKNKELAIPYQMPEEHKTERIVLGSLQRWGQSLEVIPEGVGILGGEILMLDGKIFKDTPLGILSDTKMKLGEKLINAANSSLEEKRKRQAQVLLPMTKEESESALAKSISTVTDYGSQILLALATGGTAALATMGARMAGETAVQGLEQYKTEHPEDKELKGFLTTGNLSKEVLLNAGKTAINLYVEKAIGVPQQVAQFKKALKTPAVGAMGVLKAAGKGYAMGFGEEWATETIQGITDTTFDAFLGRYKDLPELANAYKESIIDAVYAGVFGGGFGASGHVLARGKAIGNVKEMMRNVVPESDLDMVATAIVDNHIASTKQMIGTQLQLSTELRDKHGEIFNAMNVAAKNAMMESGVVNTMSEDEIAQHSTELATMFADQVLAEANKRNVPIMDVIQGQDIVYDPETKELRLAPQTEESKARKAMLQYQDVAQRINEIDAEEQSNGVPEYTAPTININGLERQTTNSDGNPIAKSEKSLRYFYNWFGDSKVVDEQGRPLVVYHGTREKFDVFKHVGHKTDEGFVGEAWYFSDSKEYSSKYGKEMMNLYLSIQSPLVLNPTESEDVVPIVEKKKMASNANEAFAKKLVEDGIIPEKGVVRELFDFDMENGMYDDAIVEVLFANKEAKDILSRYGYDGVVYNGKEYREFAAYEPNQIKSTSNRGTYSLTEDNIHYQFVGENANLTPEQRASLDKAKEMKKKNALDETIRQETGWKYGRDNKWRLEVSDKDAHLKADGISAAIKDAKYVEKMWELTSDIERFVKEYKTNKEAYPDGFLQEKILDRRKKLEKLEKKRNELAGKTVSLGDIFEHKNLYNAYPELKDMKVVFVDSDSMGNADGAYIAPYGETYWHDAGGNIIKISNAIVGNKAYLRSVLLHEIQHYIQHKEGFARGGSPNDILDDVSKIAARLVHSDNSIEYRNAWHRYNLLRDVLEVYRVSEDPDKVIKTYSHLKNGSPFLPKKSNKAEWKSYINEQYDIWWKEMEEKNGDNWEFRDLIQQRDDKEIRKEFNNLSRKIDRLSKKIDVRMGHVFENLSEQLEKGEISEKDAYMRLYGEMEARLVERRSELSEEELRETPLQYDVDESDAIVVFEDGTTTAYNQKGIPGTYYQSAYAGSRVDYDKPSLEAIGSGEGNQAHGYGLYYALNKDVAEQYRTEFMRNYKSVEDYVNKQKEYYTRIRKYAQDQVKFLKENKKPNEIYFDNETVEQAIKRLTDAQKLHTKKLQELDKLDVTKPLGQVHEVDLPESPYLLDEQKTISEQSSFVKKQLKEVAKETGITYDSRLDIGKQIYDKLSYSLGSDKVASQLLEKYGIKGITYDGRADGRCFVIFNPDDVNVIQKFYQDQEQRGRRPKGMFDANSKVIKLFERADASTLDHELAHFWLDNMWTYANSGAASETYKAQFDAVKSFLGVDATQSYLTYAQHEKFASAYEKYIHRGIIPNSMMGNVFDNYERFIRNVYDSINDIRYSTKNGKRAFKLTPEIIKFFDSMLTGGVDGTSLNAEMVSEERNEEAQKADDTTMKDAKEVVREMPNREVPVAEDIKPVESTGETKESRLFERLKGLAGSIESVGYNVANIEENREKARKMWAENPDRARAILNGTETADDVLRQTLYTEQQKIALQVGDTTTYLNSLRKQTAEATRMGQELSALRGVVEDITDPSYWIRSAELEALKNLAKKQTKNLENALGNSPLIELTSRLDQEIKSLQKAVASKATNEEKLATLKDGAERIAEKYQGLDQPDTVFNQVDWDNEEYANDYIENKVKEKLGIALSTEKAKAFIQTARELDALSRTRDKMGLPSDAFFAKKDELERMRNSHTPTSRTKVLISTIGRSNMLTAPATSVLNVVSNTQNYALENIIRKVNNVFSGHTNDNLVSQDLIDKYRARTWDIFWKTGYDVSMMSSLLDERLYKGESVTHSEGDGAIRAVGRFAEKYVFSRLISSPDIYFRSYLGFPNFVGNEATEIAYKEGLTGKKAKARADQLFKDAIKIEPETEQGKMIREKARLDSLILTFQQDTKMAQMLTGIRTKINEGLGDIGIGDILSPFIKTPANIISMGFDASVGAFASPVNLIGAINDIRHGNIKSARVLQAVRQTTTATLAYTVLGLLVSMCIDDDDYIPDYAQLTQSQRNAVRAMGGSFGSVRIGNEWVSTDFFGTLEMPLVVFLNTRRTGNVLKGLASGVGSKFLDAPVLKDILGSSDAIKDFATDKNDIISAIGENVANAAISRLTPNAMNTIARLIDNKDRKANNVLDKLVARIPFARQTLDERLNVATGLPQELGRINTLLLGSRGKLQETAPLAVELGRLAGVGQAANISDPTRAGDLKLLPDAEKKIAQNLFAIEYSRQAGKLVRTSTYARMTDEAKKEALNKVKKEVVDAIKKKYRTKLVALKNKK